MKRGLGAGVLIVAALAAIVVWQCGGSDTGQATTARKPVTTAAGPANPHRDERPDPRTLKRASIAGTISNEDRAVVPGARVCANVFSRHLSSEQLHAPRCVTADAQGRYTIGELYAATHSVVASAKPYRPDIHHPKGDRKETEFELAAGETKIGVDIVLRKGGVEISGTVSDVTGGPIANAAVRAQRDSWGDQPSPPVETDAHGKFTLWVRPGEIHVSASAEGYTEGTDDGSAPGKFEILLTPESSLAGTVVDAKTGEPIAGVPVSVAPGDWDWDSEDSLAISDEQGKFRVSRLEPGRYKASAKSPHGFGKSEGSTLVGLGQHVDGVVVKLHAAVRVAGTIVLPDRTVCKRGSFELRDKLTERSMYSTSEPDGALHADGVLAGTYQVSVSCEDYISRDKYPDIEIKDKDIDGLVWEVDAGAVLRGKVLSSAGTPIEDAEVWARSVGGAARAKTDWGSDSTTRDGTYELKGLKAATFKVEVGSDEGNGPKDGWKVDIATGATVEKDLVLEDGGSIKGVVIDAQGKPVSGVHVRAQSLTAGWRWGGNSVRSSDDGTFVLEDLRPGDYRVMAHRGWWSDDLRKPGSTDDAKQGERVSVSVAKIASVKLVVESQAGTIKGSVVDSAGKPVSDAYVVAARESDAAGAAGSSVASTRWSADEKPVLSNTEGQFVLTNLSPGKYTLRAFRKGGGEAVAEHIPIGGSAKLQIRSTGSIEGLVRRPGAKLDEIEIELSDIKTGFERSETFFRTDGRFAIHDLPKGSFTVTVSAENGKKQLTVDLAEGQRKTGVDVTLDELVSLTGRVIDHVTKQPVPGIRMSASIGKQGYGGFSWRSMDDDQPEVSADDGRFTIENAPRGTLTIRGFPKDFMESEYGWITALREVSGNGTAGSARTTIDIGDVTVMKRRHKRNESAGDLGVHWAEAPDGTDIDKHEYKVSYIDPAGPAAKTELKVGDIVTTIDAVDVTGINHSNGSMLLRAPPGTPIKLGLARGPTVTIVLAPPS